ncbi:hypothetical protein DI487_13255 [Flavobacterium sediminis]|uniref:Cytochrome c domain-containing protein n=1 Tax=Flavobacterium sediminis TaxID=2201181 RepID=A0A2U8QXE0_9FLAO|nr:c-type cytochrome [Flavobacterium sediminis]AWM14729.1 hypothetical protein DI487_13255 [Flavobacterium sediminis]
MRSLKVIISFSFFILFSSILILAYIFFRESKREIEHEIPTLAPICGTKSLTENQSIGRQLFNENCSACHHIRRNFTGPNLMNTDSLIFFNWLSKNSPAAKKSSVKIEFGQDYHQKMWNERLNDDEISKIYQYCRYFSNE